MSSEDLKPNDKPPCCKPFRLSELIIIIICFILLFLLRQFNVEDEIICSYGVLIVFFTCIGSTLFITVLDVFCQAIREPIPNFPMILCLVVGTLMSLASGITAVVVHWTHEKSNSHRNLNTLCLFSGASFFASLFYILDLLIVIRYSSLQK